MRPLALLMTTVVALGCAPARPAFVRANPVMPSAPLPPARGEFTRGAGELVLRAAQAVLRANGNRIVASSEHRLSTVQRERDVPCGAGSCLARESIEVRVGHHIARLDLTRVLWNASTRMWDPALGPVEAQDALAQEQLLLRRILSSYATLAPGELAAGPHPVGR